MAKLLSLIKKIPEFLKRSPYLVTLPSGFSVIQVEKILEVHFTCPCAVDVNAKLTESMPLKFGRFHCPPGANNDTQQDCAKAFIYCLIPPIMWVIVLFLNGDYFSCAKTHWNGVYVFDEQLNRSWCKPIERTQNENELRLLTQKYIHDSQNIGYVILAISSVMVIVVVGIYDSCISGKCDRCPKQLLSCCGRTAEGQRQGQVWRQSHGQRKESVSLELCSEGRINVEPAV
ncbi:Calcium homeostasis modulator protein 5 [Labeo rohita]|uniref:Calcium homeostasis modulator protein 5 n=1 Tax=Labeo rohita TaxID=84645 RepID=A0ABQ8LII1_LABRO|nr:Calcium homeostasis modulator protein 5 [Labeo rohita]